MSEWPSAPRILRSESHKVFMPSETLGEQYCKHPCREPPEPSRERLWRPSLCKLEPTTQFAVGQASRSRLRPAPLAPLSRTLGASPIPPTMWEEGYNDSERSEVGAISYVLWDSTKYARSIRHRRSYGTLSLQRASGPFFKSR